MSPSLHSKRVDWLVYCVCVQYVCMLTVPLGWTQPPQSTCTTDLLWVFYWFFFFLPKLGWKSTDLWSWSIWDFTKCPQSWGRQIFFKTNFSCGLVWHNYDTIYIFFLIVGVFFSPPRASENSRGKSSRKLNYIRKLMKSHSTHLHICNGLCIRCINTEKWGD